MSKRKTKPASLKRSLENRIIGPRLFDPGMIRVDLDLTAAIGAKGFSLYLRTVDRRGIINIRRVDVKL